MAQTNIIYDIYFTRHHHYRVWANGIIFLHKIVIIIFIGGHDPHGKMWKNIFFKKHNRPPPSYQPVPNVSNASESARAHGPLRSRHYNASRQYQTFCHEHLKLKSAAGLALKTRETVIFFTTASNASGQSNRRLPAKCIIIRGKSPNNNRYLHNTLCKLQ